MLYRIVAVFSPVYQTIIILFACHGPFLCGCLLFSFRLRCEISSSRSTWNYLIESDSTAQTIREKVRGKEADKSIHASNAWGDESIFQIRSNISCQRKEISNTLKKRHFNYPHIFSSYKNTIRESEMKVVALHYTLLRDGLRLQYRWNFRKFSNGGGGGCLHLQSNNLCCKFWTFKQGFLSKKFEKHGNMIFRICMCVCVGVCMCVCVCGGGGSKGCLTV